MTDKPLSERVAEYLQMSEAYGFAGMLDTQLIREQQALIGEWERKAANWFASPEAAQQLDGYRELAMRAFTAEEERDRLRDENEALRADAERYRRLRENWIDCGEIGLHGRLAVVDAVVDKAIDAARSQS